MAKKYSESTLAREMKISPPARAERPKPQFGRRGEFGRPSSVSSPAESASSPPGSAFDAVVQPSPEDRSKKSAEPTQAEPRRHRCQTTSELRAQLQDWLKEERRLHTAALKVELKQVFTRNSLIGAAVLTMFVGAFFTNTIGHYNWKSEVIAHFLVFGGYWFILNIMHMNGR